MTILRTTPTVTVTGSKYLVEADGVRLMVDCILVQGAKTDGIISGPLSDGGRLG
jgi:hypothetical protein